MTRLRWLVPVLSLAALTVVGILPWGLASANRFVLPLLPIVAIYYWTLDEDAWLPEWVVFLAGLLLDVLTQGPLGYWALIYLVTYVVGVLSSRAGARTTLQRLLLFAVAILAVTSFAWLAASSYFLEPLDWEPYARGAGIAVLAAVAITLAMRVFRPPDSSRRPARHRPVRLTRGQ